MVGSVLFFTASANADTETAEPDAFLDYIEATGSQYIDSGRSSGDLQFL
jgi:hypothetical protein